LRLIIAVTALSALLFAYPVWRLCEWLNVGLVPSLAITLPLFLSQLVARLALRGQSGPVAFLIRGVADFFLGLAPVLLGLVLLGELLLLPLPDATRAIAATIICVTAAVGLWGLRNAWRPEVVTVPLMTRKLNRTLRFVQISDVHIGSRSARYLRQIIDAVNALRPEFLCITGDFIDQPGVSIDKLAALREVRVPIYYCIGNHERYEDLQAIIARLQTLGVQVLRNQTLEVGELQLIGIDDHSNAQQVARVLPFLELRPDLYQILLYHRPQGLEAAQAHGIDLKLSGHTHAGQIVPFNLAVNRVFKYTRGLYRLGDTHLYVNEGSGTWGPTLRLGTRSEITLFEIAPGDTEPGEAPEKQDATAVPAAATLARATVAATQPGIGPSKPAAVAQPARDNKEYSP
jgi:predicted MPP superfamily phosphohydrolase